MSVQGGRCTNNPGKQKEEVTADKVGMFLMTKLCASKSTTHEMDTFYKNSRFRK